MTVTSTFVTNDFNSEPQISVSDLAQRRPIRGLKVVLEGSNSNRNAIGATVRVHAGGQIYTKYNDGKSGYLAVFCPLYFGLGDAPRIDRVEVDWPSGRKQLVRAPVEENQTLVITAPKCQLHDENQATAQRSASLRWRREPRLPPTLNHSPQRRQ